MKWTPAFLVMALFLIACNNKPETEANATGAPVDTSQEREAIANVIKREVAAVNAGDPNAFLAVLHDDVEIMPLNEASIRDNEARKWLEDFMSQYTLMVDPYSNEEVEINGDLAYHRYSFNWKVIPKKGGDTISEQGAGLHILKRKADGSWAILKDIWHPQAASPVTK